MSLSVTIGEKRTLLITVPEEDWDLATAAVSWKLEIGKRATTGNPILNLPGTYSTSTHIATVPMTLANVAALAGAYQHHWDLCAYDATPEIFAKWAGVIDVARRIGT